MRRKALNGVEQWRNRRAGHRRPAYIACRPIYTVRMTNIKISPYAPKHKAQIITLSIDAWTPVFAKTESQVPSFAWDAFYPNGWQVRQTDEVEALLKNEPQNIWVAHQGDEVMGYSGIRLHPEDQMGEIYIIAVSPVYQRQGVSTALMKHAENYIRGTGAKMIMVETIADSGHEPARRAYEAFGFERWPVARYFKKL